MDASSLIRIVPLRVEEMLRRIKINPDDFGARIALSVMGRRGGLVTGAIRSFEALRREAWRVWRWEDMQTLPLARQDHLLPFREGGAKNQHEFVVPESRFYSKAEQIAYDLRPRTDLEWAYAMLYWRRTREYEGLPMPSIPGLAMAFWRMISPNLLPEARLYKIQEVIRAVCRDKNKERHDKLKRSKKRQGRESLSFNFGKA